MRIIVAGGSGFLGRALCQRLARDGHTVIVLTRDGDAARPPGLVRYASWTPDGEAGSWSREIESSDAIVNLAGAGIADKRWTASRKRVLRDSRVLSTRSLVKAIRKVTQKPTVLIQGSGAGYYGSYADNGPILDETSPPGSDFLSGMAVAWEAEAQPASALGCRVVYVRTTPVLSSEGGALAKLLPPFKAFVGGPLGSGRQTWSWVHRDDWVSLVMWALGNPAVAGPLNAASPYPVSNAEFSRALGRALHRPSWIPVPAPVLRIMLGDMADEALLRGQHVIPKRPLELGFKFSYEKIDDAMKAAIDETVTDR